jgi:hypothetical protein
VRGLAAFTLLLAMAGCAHPQSIQKTSKDQAALLLQFQTSLDDVRTRVRTALNDSIRDYKDARARKWVTTEVGLLSSRIVACTPATCPQPVSVLLEAAADYLARGEATLFGDFCGPSGTWQTRPEWMKRPGDVCPSRLGATVRDLEQIRDRLDDSLKQIGEDTVSIQKAHAVIDKFLQIRIELTQENVDSAQKAVDKATAAEEDVRKVLAQISAKGRP